MINKAAIIIAQHRAVNKLSRREFGEKYNVTYGAVTGWENEGKIPSPELIRAIEASGVCRAQDWFDDAYLICGRCELGRDDPARKKCIRTDCARERSVSCGSKVEEAA